jgi:hypothetical protein
VVWTNLTVSFDEKPTANTLMLKVLGQIYVMSPFDKIKFKPRYCCTNAGMLPRRPCLSATKKRPLTDSWANKSA